MASAPPTNNQLCPKVPCSEDDRLSGAELRTFRRARSIDEFRTTSHPELQAVIDDATRHISASYRRVPAEVRKHVEVLIVNLYAAWLRNRRRPAVRYSLHRDDYHLRELRRLYSLSYRTFVQRVVPCLVAAGLIRARCGLIEPDRLLSERFESIGWNPCAITFSSDFPEVRLRRRKKPVMGADGRIKRNKDGIAIKFAPVMLQEDVPQLEREIAEYTAEMKAINARTEPTFVYPLVADAELRRWKRNLDVTRRRMYRVFNNVSSRAKQLEQGGRIYGHWAQSLNESQRLCLVIDNEPAWEIDFSSMEVALAYSDAGKQIPLHKGYDAYLPPGVPRTRRRRARYKQLLLIMLNSDPGLAYDQETKKQDTRTKALKAALRARDLSHLGEAELRRRIEQLEAMHLPHIPIYGKKAGMKRMFRESQIARCILRRLILERNIICLPVHDSFLVPASKVLEAQEVICSEFTAATGFKVKVKIQPTEIPAGLTSATADRQKYSEFFRQLDAHRQRCSPNQQ